jgi:hypothetical protein
MTIEGNDVDLAWLFCGVDSFPASKVPQQARRQTNGGLAFVRLTRSVRVAMEDALSCIDDRLSGAALPSCTQNGTGSRPGVERNKQESTKVAQRTLVRLDALLNFVRAPASPK